MEDELLELAQAAVEACGADQAEAVVQEVFGAVTRFANNRIHQNTSERSRSVTVRAVVGKRTGIASGTAASVGDAHRIAQEARELARVAAELPDFVSLPEPLPVPEAPATVADDVRTATPARRAELVASVVELAESQGLRAAGALSIGEHGVAVANSLGVAVAHGFTQAHFHVVMEKENGSGYAAAEGRTLAETRVEETARRAAQKAHIAQNPRRVEAQPMMVVLEPVAAAELLEMFLHGFSALTYQEGRSFVCDTLGEQVCAPVLSITDDGLDERTYVMPFDYEGVPRQRVELVREGVINNLVYDTYTAGREKPPRRSTGHAMPPPAPWGPYPCNCIVRPGDGTLEDLVATVDKGLLVSRVHYLNLVHPRKMILTGMTRDGTFLIENGNILCGVRNLRFTERFVEALGRLVAVGQNGELHENIWTPSLVIDNFCFTSETEF